MPRPISRAISSAPLQQAQVKSNAPALAVIAQSLAGRVRYLYELATGVPAIAADGIVTPTNPQGRAGVDRSGPPWGDALQHPLWIYEGTGASTNLYGEEAIMSFTTTGEKQLTTAKLIVRPFQQAPLTPYSRGLLVVRGIRTAGAGTASATIRIYGAEGQAGPSQSTTLTMSTAGITSSGEAYTPLIPGYQERIIEIEATASVAFDIVLMSINQVARRSH
jgi:hypothetical protein